MMHRIFAPFLLAAGVLVCGCSLSGPQVAISEPIATLEQATQQSFEVSLTIPTASPTASPPSETALPSATWTETAVPTPTYHPMSIPALRLTPYPSSPIKIEQELDRGANYRRYYASYLSEGLRIYGLLTIPDGETPPEGWPAIIFNHGYIPPKVYRTTERYIAYVDTLARNGYIVFRIDYRGHDRSEGEASGAYGHPGYTVDVLNAVAAIRDFPLADSGRIGMWGHSMGGFLTLRSMVISPDIKAGVIWAGVVAPYPDLLTRWRHNTNGPTPTPPPTARRWRTAWIEQYGSPETNPDFWNSISANSYLNGLSGPVQLHHGTADADVPVEFSEILTTQIQAVGQAVEFYEYPDDNHNIANNFNLAMARTVEFFDRHLK